MVGIEGMLFLIPCMFVTEKRQTLFQKRLNSARQNTAEIKKKKLEGL